MEIRRWGLWAAACGLAMVSACQERNTGQARRGDDDQEPPRWHFERIDHLMGEMTLNDVWGRGDGAVFVVGWYGTIFTNRVTRANPAGNWKKMESNTTEHLTAIWGVENGDQFRQQSRRDGEMFAVGWTGTLLHYHPNPTNKPSPVPEDGRWEVVAGPGKGWTPRVKIDPFCPDADGDGILDDAAGALVGNGPDGWWSLKDTCRAGARANCDDNCRLSPNGSQRPMVDLNNNFGVPPPAVAQNCIEWNGDGPSNDLTLQQQDTDGDGVGSVCDDSVGVIAADSFLPALFDVWAAIDPADSTQLIVVAVGEDGAVITYQGPNAAQTVAAPQRPVSDQQAWIAQEHVAYWYSNDCPFLDPATPAGGTCGSGRLPPSCAAQCTSYKPQCDCAAPASGTPVACCVTGEGDPRLVGAACQGPGCTSSSPVQPTSAYAANGCAGTAGVACSTLCPFCFRTLTKTLRSLAVDANGNVVAVGAGGTVVTLGLAGGNDPTGVWVANDFAGGSVPPPMDERPLLTAISQRDGGFHMVGAAGVVAGVSPGAAPMVTDTRCRDDAVTVEDEGIPAAFLSGIFSFGQQRGYAVGDRGTLVEFGGAATFCEVIDTDTVENFLAIWVTYVQGVERLWMVGANGAVVRGGYY